MKSRTRPPWKPWGRPVVYLLLALVLIDYFLIEPARVDPSRLPPPPPPLEQLASRLKHHVGFLASRQLAGRKPGTTGNRRAEEYILGEFQNYGLVPVGPRSLRTQRIHPEIGRNVFSAFPPVESPRPWLILGAHLDHLGEENGRVYFGADDNASGVAIMLETARLARHRLHLKHYNLMFVAFNSEESPYFLTRWMGSHFFLHHLEPLGLRPGQIASAVIMDLMGGVFWKPIQDTLFAMGAEKSPEIAAALEQVSLDGLTITPLGMHMIESVPTTGRMIFSDYQVFREHQIPFLFLSSGRTPDYHRPTDTSDRLHYSRMARTTLWLLNYLERLDHYPEITWRPFRERYEQDLKSIFPLVSLAAGWWSKIPQTGWISLYRLKQDRMRLSELRKKIERGGSLGPDEARALSLASIRLQCLLGKMGPCFLVPGQGNKKML